MARRQISDLDLVNDALSVAYSPVTGTPENTMRTATLIKLKALPDLPYDSTLNKRASTKPPRATWLDHMIPVPSSSSPISIAACDERSWIAEREACSDEIRNLRYVHDSDPQTSRPINIHDTNKGDRSSAVGSQPDLNNPHGAYMSGALQDSPSWTRIGDHSGPILGAQPSVRVSPGTQAPVLAPPHLNLRLPTMEHCPTTRFEPKSQAKAHMLGGNLTERMDVDPFREHALRRTLRLVSPELSKQSQWHAWKVAEEMLATKTPDEAGDISMNSGGDLRVDRCRESMFGIDTDDTEEIMRPTMSQTYPPDTIMTAIEQRRESIDSEGSVGMEISPEDNLKSYAIYQNQPMASTNTICAPDAGSGVIVHKAGQYYSTLTFEKNSFDCQIAGELNDKDASAYDRDHRGYHVRPVQLPTSEYNSSCSSHDNNRGSVLDKDVPEHITPPRRHPVPNHHFFQTTIGTACTNTGNSPFRTQATPLAFENDVRLSVERDVQPRRCIRESTPVYTDRSASPSPMSQIGNRPLHTGIDLEMLHDDDDSLHSTRSSPSPPCPTTGANPMLPPPSPVRSRASSPSGRHYDSASPSMLRSPAIMRVLDQFQLSAQDRDTFLPIPARCSRSPSPSPKPSSIRSDSCLKAPSSILKSRSIIMPEQCTIEPAITSSTAGIRCVQTFPLILTPPPIPDTDILGLVYQRKRNGRRKSVVQSSTAKVGKGRSVTGGNSDVRVQRVVTKQRIVTLGLAKALDVGVDVYGIMDASVNVCRRTDSTKERHDDEMDLDDNANGHGEVVPEELKQEQHLRRSMRIRTRKR